MSGVLDQYAEQLTRNPEAPDVRALRAALVWLWGEEARGPKPPHPCVISLANAMRRFADCEAEP